MIKSLIAFLFTSAAFAQTGSIGGIVRTVAGAGVPVSKASVQAKNTATGTTYSALSADNGGYTVTALPAGDYDLSAEAPAFLPFKQERIHVQPGVTTNLNIRLKDFQLETLGDGGVEFAYLNANKPAPSGPTPRTREGKPDFGGIWLPVLPAPVREKAQLTPWAEAEMKQRKQRKELPPQTRCLPMGIGLQGFFIEYRVMQTPEFVAIINGNGDPARQFYLDGRSHPKDPNPSFLGHSVARWDGDTLVVDTIGFNNRVWLGFDEYPQTEALHVSERYRRPDLGHLEVQGTYEDPTTFKKPFTTKQVHSLAPKDMEMFEYVCTENNRDLEHMR
jgi:hypothetical protein